MLFIIEFWNALPLHVAVRIGFIEMINPSKAKRLRAIFEEIQWT